MKLCLSSDSVPTTDRALGVGHGLFETMLVLGGEPLLLQYHLNRLDAGAKALKIDVELSNVQAEIESFVSSEASDLWVLKLILTGGDGGRGYLVDSSSEPRLILSAYPAPQLNPTLWIEGLRVRICDHRLPLNPALAGFKHLNRLDQILARAEWSDSEIDDGLLLDSEDRLVEATSSNLFLLFGNELRTPLLDNCGVAGTMRQYLLENLEDIFGMPLKEARVSVEDLGRADALFLANSVRGVMPVNRVVQVCDKPSTSKIRDLADTVHRSLGLTHLAVSSHAG